MRVGHEGIGGKPRGWGEVVGFGVGVGVGGVGVRGMVQDSKGGHRAVIWIFELFDSPVDFFVTE